MKAKVWSAFLWLTKNKVLLLSEQVSEPQFLHLKRKDNIVTQLNSFEVWVVLRVFVRLLCAFVFKVLSNHFAPGDVFLDKDFYIFSCTVSLLLHRHSLVAASGLLSSCSAWASHCSGFSCCGAQALGKRASVIAPLRLQSLGSVALVHGLSCPVVHGIFPDQRSNPRSLHWQADS